jgi:hypothetical protein
MYFQALLPPGIGPFALGPDAAVGVSYAMMAAAAQLLPSPVTSNSMAAIRVPPPPPTASISAAASDAALRFIYVTLGVGLTRSVYSPPAVTVQPLALMNVSSLAGYRAVGVATMCAEYQLGVALSLGAALLSALPAVPPAVAVPLSTAASMLALQFAKAASSSSAFTMDLGNVHFVAAVFHTAGAKLLPNTTVASAAFGKWVTTTSYAVVVLVLEAEQLKQEAVSLFPGIITGGVSSVTTDFNVLDAVITVSGLAVVQHKAFKDVLGMVQSGSPADMSTYQTDSMPSLLEQVRCSPTHASG